MHPARPPSRSARRRARRRTRRRTWFGGLVALALIGGGVTGFALVSSDDTPKRALPEPSTSSTTTTSTLPPTTTTLRDPRRGSGQPVTFAFGGDIHFEGVLRKKLQENPTTMFAPIAPIFSLADLTMVNLESAITDRNTAIPKQYNFKSPAVAIQALRAAGVDVINQANNHSIDFGPEGLADTLLAKATSPIPIVGVGNNRNEAYTPFLTTVKGQRIAMFGATDVMGEEHVEPWTATPTKPGIASTKYEAQDFMVKVIKYVRPTVDTIVVFLHWGVERVGCATDRQKALARALIDAGADIIVGSHAHHLEGAGRNGTAFVAYGLGNFAFYNESGEYGRTGVLLVTATGRDIDSYQWVPARIRGGIPTPYPAGAEHDAEVAHFNKLRECTDLSP